MPNASNTYSTLNEIKNLLLDLKHTHTQYYETITRFAKEKRGYSLFGFIKHGEDTTESTHDSYLKDFEKKTLDLANALSTFALENAEEAESFAKEAAFLMLCLDCPVSDRNAAYIPVIRCFANNFLPYISSANQHILSDQWLKHTLERHMLPNEHKLFLRMKNS